MSLLIERHTPEEMLRSIAAYLPTGDLFTAALIPNSNLNLLLEGLSQELLRAENFLFLYNSQFIPSETTVFIEEWESALGIPDDCFLINESDTNEQRRLNILVKLASLGVQTSADFENLAAILGFPGVRVLPGVGSDDDSIINGEFNIDSDWTKGTGWTIFAGTANHLFGAAGDLSQDITAVTGTLYAVSYDVLFTDTGTVTPNVGGTDGITRSENGSYEEVIEAGGVDTLFSMIADASFNGSVDNVTVNGSLIAGSTPRFTIVVEFPTDDTSEIFPLEFPIPFGNSTFSILQCLFTKLKPANCDIVFEEVAPIIPQGNLLMWGGNQDGQLGLGDTENRSSPVQVGTDSNWVQVRNGTTFSLGVKSDGTMFAWGDNSSGELGLGDTENRSSPVQVGPDTDWIQVNAEFFDSFGLKSNGSLFAWGLNLSGELGLGDLISRSSPVQIGTDLDWAQVEGAPFHTFGLKLDGSLFGWGQNVTGQLGLSDNETRSSPVQVGTDKDWIQADGGGNSSIVLKSNGTMFTMGDNEHGQLGHGDTIPQSSPVQVGTDSDWVQISMGNQSVLALKSNGTLFAWGLNNAGQLGLGDEIDRSSPVQVGINSNWAHVEAADLMSLGLKTDGRLFTWGTNSRGQLGVGDTIGRSSPIQVGMDKNWIQIHGGTFSSMGLIKIEDLDLDLEFNL